MQQYSLIITFTHAIGQIRPIKNETNNHRTQEAPPSSSDEVDHDEVQQDVREDEVCESPLRTDPRKLRFVLGIDLIKGADFWHEVCMKQSAVNRALSFKIFLIFAYNLLQQAVS